MGFRLFFYIISVLSAVNVQERTSRVNSYADLDLKSLQYTDFVKIVLWSYFVKTMIEARTDFPFTV